MRSVRPLGERVLVRLDDGEDTQQTPGGLFRVLPRMFRKGTVVRVGPGCILPLASENRQVHYRTQVQPGERVCFPAGVLDTSQGEALRPRMPDGHALIHERDILFVIEEGDPQVELV
jgi:co-chaperonin GroES (HSP10)